MIFHVTIPKMHALLVGASITIIYRLMLFNCFISLRTDFAVLCNSC